jgi:hypothetical protein
MDMTWRRRRRRRRRGCRGGRHVINFNFKKIMNIRNKLTLTPFSASSHTMYVRHYMRYSMFPAHRTFSCKLQFYGL